MYGRLEHLVDVIYGIPGLDEEEPPGNDEEFFKDKSRFSEEVIFKDSEFPKYYFHYDPLKKPFEYFSEN